MAVNLAIATGLFWSSIWTILTLASPAARVDLCGFDEISDVNFTLSLNFSSENKMKKGIECSRVILLKSSRVKIVVEELNIASGAVLKIQDGPGPNKGEHIGPKADSQMPLIYVSSGNALFILFKNGQGENGPSSFRGKIVSEPYQDTCNCRGVTNGSLECSESDHERKCKVKCERSHMDLSINKGITCDLGKGKWDIDMNNTPPSCQKVQKPSQVKATVNFNYANLSCGDIVREQVQNTFREFIGKNSDVKNKGVCFSSAGNCSGTSFSCTDDNSSAKVTVTVTDHIVESPTLKEANSKLQELVTAYESLQLLTLLDSDKLIMKKRNKSFIADKDSFTKKIAPLCNDQYDYIKVPGTNTFVCSTCPRHHEYNGTSHICQICPTGSFASEGAKNCIKKNDTGRLTPLKTSCMNACMKGKQLNASSGMCEWCPLDTYQNSSVKLKPECAPCPDQKKTIFPGAQSVAECLDPCSSGTFRNTSHDSCQDCPIGFYMDVDKHAFTKCKMCDNGETTRAVGSKEVNDCYSKCMPGQFYNSQTKMCSPCPEGKYQDEINMDTCKDCPGGKTTLDSGSHSSSACVTLCGPGQFLNKSTDKCDDCPLNTYQDLQQHHYNECKSCGLNKFTQATKQSNISQCGCSKGWYMNISVSQCNKCPKGKYQDQFGQEQCKQCPDGKSTVSDEQSDKSSCLVTCSEGQFFDPSKKACYACPKGSYQEAKYHFQENCISCPSKKTTVQEGASDSKTCIHVPKATAKEGKLETIKMSLRFVSLTWREELEDENSARYQKVEQTIEDAITFEFHQDPSFEAVEVTNLRKGSVIAEFDLQFNGKADYEPVKILQDAVQNGKVANLTVSSESLKILRQSCIQPLGMENGQIKDDQITASTFFLHYEPFEGRLNAKGGRAWHAEYTHDKEYLQIDFRREVNITAVATQGQLSSTQEFYVKAYKLDMSDDGKTWNEYRENDKPKVLVLVA